MGKGSKGVQSRCYWWELDRKEGRKERVWKMKVSSRLTHKQDGLVEEAEKKAQ